MIKAKHETIGKVLNLVFEHIGRENVPRFDLPRILMALQKVSTQKRAVLVYFVERNQIEYVEQTDGHYNVKVIDFFWNLSFDADWQSEETLQSLISILKP